MELSCLRRSVMLILPAALRRNYFFLFAGLFVLLSPMANAQQKWGDIRNKWLQLTSDTVNKDSALFYAYKLKEVALEQYGKNTLEYYRSLNSVAYSEYELKHFQTAKNVWLSACKSLPGGSDTTYNKAKAGILYNLFYKIYTSYTKQADSALLFGQEYLKAFGIMNGETSRVLLNEMCAVALSLDQNFGRAYADQIYAQSLKIRQQIWGTKSVTFTQQLDSVLTLQFSPAKLPTYRYNIYSVFDIKPSLTQLDSLAKNAKAAGQWANYIFFYNNKKDEVLIDHPDSVKKYAYTLQELGTAYREFGLYDAGIFCHDKALAIIDKLEGKNTVDYGNLLLSKGHCYLQKREFLNTRFYYQQALETYAVAKGRSSNEYASGLSQIVYLYTFFLQHRDYYPEKDRIENPYQLMLDTCKKLLTIRAELFGKTSIKYAESLRYLGDTHVIFQKYDEAEKVLKECWRIYQLNNSDKPTEAMYTLSRQLYELYFTTDRLSKAIPWIEKCVSIKEIQNDIKSTNYRFDLYALCLRYLDAGNETQAKIAMQKLKQQLGNYQIPSREYDIILGLEMSNRNYGPEKRDSIYKLYIDNTLLTTDSSTLLGAQLMASAYGVVALYYEQDNRLDKAYQYAVAELKYYTKAHFENDAVSSNSYRIIAKYFAYVANKPDSANVYFNKVLQAAATTKDDVKDFLTSFNNTLEVACFYWYNDQIPKAADVMNEAVTKIKNQMLMNMAGYDEAARQKYSKKLQESIQTYYNFHQSIYRNYLQSDTTAYNYAIQSKGILLSTGNQLKDEIIASKDTVLRQKYAHLIQLKKLLAKAYTLSDEQLKKQDLSIGDLEKQASGLEEQLSSISTAYADFQKQNQFKFKDVRASLKPGDAAIEFITFPYFDRTAFKDSVIYAAFIIRPENEQPVYVSLTDDKAIKPYIQNQGIAGRGITLEGAANSDAFKRLYQLIWQPLSAQLQNVKRIYIATDGLLNNVSFAALQDATGKYLSDYYDLRFLLNTRDVISYHETPPLKTNNLTFALFGGAKYDAVATIKTDSLLAYRSLPSGLQGNTAWNYLPGTLSEVQLSAAILKKQNWRVTTYTGAQASEKNFKNLEGPGSPAIIHIATHGFYFPPKKNTAGRANVTQVYQEAENPLMRAGLIFAAANQSWQGNFVTDGEEDGILTAYELANMDLSNTQLVILSACETGTGEILNGEGVFGMQRALRQAGLKKMIVSLWPVPDKETSEMMQEFYKALTTTKNINSAFRQAQSKMRLKYPGKPGLWAGFVLIE